MFGTVHAYPEAYRPGGRITESGWAMFTESQCDAEACDTFQFMAKYLGLSVLHPGGIGHY